MAGMPWPQESDAAAQLYDHCTLGERLLPGLCKVKVTGGVEIDKGKSGTAHGANLKLKGTKPSDVTIDWRVWEPEQWLEMQEILEELESPRGKKDLQPLVIFHPVTFARHVDNVAVETIQGPDWDDKGYMVVQLRCVEWNKPVTSGKGIGTATSAKTGTPGSEWEQMPDKSGHITTTDKDGNVIDQPVVEFPTTANANKPSKTDTDP